MENEPPSKSPKPDQNSSVEPTSLIAFWQELKKRKVVRAAITYALVGWIVMQVGDTVFPNLGIPQWVLTTLIVIVISGFPICLVAAWVYELTPGGIQPTNQQNDSENGSSTSGSKAQPSLPLLIIAAAVPTLVFGTLAAFLYVTRSAPDANRIASLDKSIAVLPFQNLSSVEDSKYFAAGIHDGLITDLAKIGSLKVISRTSTLRYTDPKGKSLAEIASELNVGIIVEGSVQRVGNLMHINAQLINAATDEHIWSERYERSVSNVLVLQSEIAKSIARAVNVALTDDEESRLNTTRTINPEVYEAYLRGRYYLDNPKRGEPRLGLDFMRKAIEIDPADPLAYAGLAEAYVILAHGFNPPDDAFPKARAAVDKALSLDPLNAQAHAVDAHINLYYEYDYDRAESAFYRAIELNPNLALNRYHYAWYLALIGRFDEALEQHEIARELDPLSPKFTIDIAAIYLLAYRAEDALDFLENLAPEFRNHRSTLHWKGAALSMLGRHDEAITVHKQLAEQVPMLIVILSETYAAAGRADEALAIVEKVDFEKMGAGIALFMSVTYASLGNFDACFELLNRKPRHSWFPWIRGMPPFTPIREDPRFPDLIHQANLPLIDYQTYQPLEKRNEQGEWVPIR